MLQLADLQEQQTDLLAMFGMGNEPLYIDIKPPDLLTAAEQRIIGRRLWQVTEQLGPS